MSTEPEMDPGEALHETMAALEAVLVVAPEPVTLKEFSRALDFASQGEIRDALNRLKERYERRPGGFVLREIAGGYQFATKQEWAVYVRKLFEDKKSRRLSRAAFETLAVVAYKQPTTRAEIEAIRGVNVSGTVQNLLEKDLIKVCGRKDGPGRPLLYGTTENFLKAFGLAALDDLPQEEEFK